MDKLKDGAVFIDGQMDAACILNISVYISYFGHIMYIMLPPAGWMFVKLLLRVIEALDFGKK